MSAQNWFDWFHGEEKKHTHKFTGNSQNNNERNDIDQPSKTGLPRSESSSYLTDGTNLSAESDRTNNIDTNLFFHCHEVETKN